MRFLVGNYCKARLLGARTKTRPESRADNKNAKLNARLTLSCKLTSIVRERATLPSWARCNKIGIGAQDCHLVGSSNFLKQNWQVEVQVARCKRLLFFGKLFLAMKAHFHDALAGQPFWRIMGQLTCSMIVLNAR